MERMQCLAASAIAYSATAVLPALVCAATKTLSPCNSSSKCRICTAFTFPCCYRSLLEGVNESRRCMCAQHTLSRCMTASFWKPSSSKGNTWARSGRKRSNSASTFLITPRIAHWDLALDLGTSADATLRPVVVGSDAGTCSFPAGKMATSQLHVVGSLELVPYPSPRQ